MRNGSVVDISQVKPAHRRLLIATDKAISAALDSVPVVAQVKTHVTNGILLAKRSGHLRDSTSAKFIRTSRGATVRVQNTAKYAWAHETGSGLAGPKGKKYPITAKDRGKGKGKRKGFLKFLGKGGQVVFRHQVMHPGVKPTHFLQVATDLVFKTRIALLQAGMRSAARNF